MRRVCLLVLTLLIAFSTPRQAIDAAQDPQAQRPPAPPQSGVIPDDERVAKLKTEALAEVEKMRDFTQQMIDQIFSFGELGFQEVETHKYLVGVLRQNGFQVEEGVAGIPTAFMATWGSGKPVIALGSDIDGIPQASQMPGVACRAPVVPGAPGHGEGHNSGQSVNITAALAVKKIMERERLPGTIMLWPGVAEEQLGTKAYLVRAGVFKDVDVTNFSHVGDNLGTAWGPRQGTGLVSVLYPFQGVAAHSAGAPSRGRSSPPPCGTTRRPAPTCTRCARTRRPVPPTPSRTTDRSPWPSRTAPRPGPRSHPSR
jgi:hypothetical protein